MLLVSDNKVNGVPSCANRKLLTDLLRDEWGFQGYIVSDCIAIQQVHTTHFFANSLEEAAALSLEAGTACVVDSRHTSLLRYKRVWCLRHESTSQCDAYSPHVLSWVTLTQRQMFRTAASMPALPVRYESKLRPGHSCVLCIFSYVCLVQL